MDSSMQVKSFNCNSCGAALQIPAAFKGRVTCPACGTECFIQGLIQNNEILKKENINSGFPHLADDATVHRAILDILGKSPCAPVDVYTNSTIVKFEKVCVPAYYYFCSGMATYTYEAGNERERQKIKGSGENMRTVTETYTEWSQMQGAANCSENYFEAANRDYSDIIHTMYYNVDSNTLVDVEELDYAPECTTLPNNQPSSVVYNQYVKPDMDKLLMAYAVNSLQNKTYRNLELGGANIHKDEEIRVCIGIYKVVLEYAGRQYTYFLSHDCQNFYGSEVPVDQARLELINQKNAQKAAIKTKFGGLLTTGIIVSIILALIFLAGMGGVVGTILAVLFIGGMVTCIVFKSKFGKVAEAERAVVQGEIDGLYAQSVQARQNFSSQGIAMQGALSHVSGNPQGF